MPPEHAAVSSPEDYTETLLELHDAEVGKLKSYYDTHKDLFEAVQKWEENWKLFLELEVLSGQAPCTSSLCWERAGRGWETPAGQ